MTVDGGLDDGGTGAVVVGRAEQLCQRQNQHAARCNAQIGVGQKFFVELGRGMQQLAEEDAQRGQQRPQHDDPHKIQRRCIGPGLQHKGLGRKAHLPADKDAQQRREQAGEQCGVLH